MKGGKHPWISMQQSKKSVCGIVIKLIFVLRDMTKIENPVQTSYKMSWKCNALNIF